MAHFTSFLFTLLLCCGATWSHAQSIRPADIVSQGNAFETVSLFDANDGRSDAVPADIQEYSLLDLKMDNIASVLSSQPEAIQLTLPTTESSLYLQLVKVDIQPEGSYVITEPSGELVKVTSGEHYRGVLKGDEGSIVALSVYDDEVMGLVSSPTMGNLVLGRLQGEATHILYNDKELSHLEGFECGTADTNEPYGAQELEGHSSHSRALTDCVKLYFEVDYDIYQDKGGTTGTTNYVTGLYNQVATMYANENINTVMQPLVIWSQTSPYSSGTSGGMLNQFTAYRQGFDGDLAMLLSYQASGGIAYVNGLCSSNPDYSMSFSSIASTYNVVPTYSWSVMVVTHEFGHLFGSQHTHACVWNGNNTAIDGCYTTEGGCGDPGIPAGGGTVMSYCHLTNVGINLNLGFGPQPGNLIRNRVTNASCTDPCGPTGPTCTDGIQNGQETGVDCGGPDCPACPEPCTDNNATMTLVLDNYPAETDWTITDSQGAILYSGGGYTQANSTVVVDLCLVGGCFDFNITDSYGDGICCNYGQGSYTVSDASGVLITGGQFGTVDTQNFCVGTVTTTCDDGVQNGQETGVDCGGPDCPACPTCNDGVQNGQETGVDCGGPECAPCASCNDGIQNGQETGVDCGGPDCPACPTCDDGVQNGQETGVDCGGPDCPACPSGCTDTEATLTLVLDNYPAETAWTITSAGGTVLYSGSGYTVANSTQTVDFCLADGCYDFTITDTYGDGICCAYGQGSFTVADGSGTLVSGGQFGSSDTQSFCIGDTDPSPTCDDGIQNGQETGVDCGGPNCDPCSTGGDELIFAHYFETGWDSWQDGGSDAYRYTGTRSYEGNHSIRLRDNSGIASSMTSPAYNTTPYTALQLEFYFYPNSMETGEDFTVNYYDGNAWQVIASFASGSSFTNNQFYSATVPVLASQYSLSTNSQFRITCDASSNADRIYIDQVSLTGLGTGSLLSDEVVITPLGRALAGTESFDSEEINLAPNPTSDMLYLTLQSEVNYSARIEVTDILGAAVLTQKSAIQAGRNEVPVAVADLFAGTYIISITDEEGERTVKKFIKID